MSLSCHGLRGPSNSTSFYYLSPSQPMTLLKQGCIASFSVHKRVSGTVGAQYQRCGSALSPSRSPDSTEIDQPSKLQMAYSTCMGGMERVSLAAPLDRITGSSFALQQQFADWTHILVHSGTISGAQTCPFIIPELIFLIKIK